MKWDQRIFVAELNVKHFRQKLAGPLDEARRRTMTALLATEEETLARLKSAAAERDLAALLDLLAARARTAFDSDLFVRNPALREAFLQSLKGLPFGIGLVDADGNMIIANEAMQHLVPSRIPSRDADRMRRFQSADELRPLQWPGARALRGDAVNPGIAFVFTSEDGRSSEVRVAAIPVRDENARIVGALAAAYDLKLLADNETRQALAIALEEEAERQSRDGTTDGAR
ncbi:hypothetical protein VW35_08150 [Devosia soli]|uniref:PAS domain-containing protein n=1 Tax=Devosia soli TaxID=361041 RepID=A0A0F5LFI5_9HYPH|nr:PAS domain-containing protein [Devosia soli]KKB80352.1 hypothetical protein VW35_08150 [Devosia soli]